MDVKQLEKVSHAEEILHGIADLCMVLQEPAIKDIPPTIFAVMEIGLESAQSLLKEITDGTVEAGKGGV